MSFFLFTLADGLEFTRRPSRTVSEFAKLTGPIMRRNS